MTLFEILYLNREMISRIKDAGARLSDIRYIEMYIDYTTLIRMGYKTSYAVEKCAGRHNISVRKTYDIIARFKKELHV